MIVLMAVSGLRVMRLAVGCQGMGGRGICDGCCKASFLVICFFKEILVDPRAGESVDVVEGCSRIGRVRV
jgi:hypothetical protein